MLVMTVTIGDEIVIKAGAQEIRLLIGGPGARRRRIGIAAPASCTIELNQAAQVPSPSARTSRRARSGSLSAEEFNPKESP